MSGAGKIFTIPAGVPFARALARELLNEAGGGPEYLPSLRILLPTRRACGAVRDAFLSLSDKPLLLPRLQPVGDVDEEELSMALAGAGDEALAEILKLPPAIEPLKRRIWLARLVMKAGIFGGGFDQALALAEALGALIDQVHTEGLSFEDLDGLAGAEFAEHWQVTVRFLKILSEEWPKILAEHNLIDAAERRNKLIRGLGEYWRKNPPAFPVIAAGSTGSIPATGELLDVVAQMKLGRVILPGLDRGMDEESWNAVAETHPQFGMKKLLERMNVDRGNVAVWPGTTQKTGGADMQARRGLLREALRPAEMTKGWADLATNAGAKKEFTEGLKNLSILECAHEREEADVVALLLRGALEEGRRTAALVTPDRALARRAATACRRWGITVDDSAGKSLDQTNLGCFLRLILQAGIQDFGPASLLALLKRKLCAPGMARSAFAEGVREIDIALRGPKPQPGLDGISLKLEERGEEKALRAWGKVAPVLRGFAGKIARQPLAFEALLKAQLEAAEELCGGADVLWGLEEGEAAAAFFAGLFEQAEITPAMSLKDYAAALGQLMKTVTVRPAFGTHPRLSILGQLEARLISADLVILGGLNEGVWPGDAGHDPWMSRPMRKEFGLPALERRTGLSAHDFAEHFCAGHVVMTRSLRQGGAPAIPSRWIQRLDAVLKAGGIDPGVLRARDELGWARGMDEAGAAQEIKRPEPRPPVHMRPRRITASRIETWLKDPYSIYAREILRLRKLDELEKAPDAADRGILLHRILEDFAEETKEGLPADAEKILNGLAERELAKRHEDPAAWAFWRPRFARIAAWLVDYELGWREMATPVLAELKGSIELAAPGGNFTLLAKPDRIDETATGAAVIDYKSGGSFTKKGITNGDKPQLAAEALIVAEGGFAAVKRKAVRSLAYWKLTGGAEAGEIIEEARDMTGAVARTREGLMKLIAAFDDPATPYFSLPRPDKAPRFNDYEHLARVKEWTALGESDSDSEAA